MITLITLPISALDSPSWATVELVFSATPTPTVATLAASAALRAISLILALICSTPVATVCTLALTCSAAAETVLASAEVSSAAEVICSLAFVRSLDDSAICWECSFTRLRMPWSVSVASCCFSWLIAA